MLHLSIAMHLTNPYAAERVAVNGPLFHRWLPDGQEDALVFPSDSSQNSLRVWFSRRGYVDNGLVRFAIDRREVDEGVMSRQGILDAGPLRGEATFAQLSASEMAAIRENRCGSDDYLRVGKRVAEFLCRSLQPLLGMLKFQYGQSWIDELLPWDSRRESLGQYCHGNFQLKWRETVDAEWLPFLPDTCRITLRSPFLDSDAYREFLTQEDWRRIQDAFGALPSPPLALRIAGRAHELSGLGLEAEAYIQAVTALELALECFLDVRAQEYGQAAVATLRAFATQGLSYQLTVVSAASGKIDSATLDAAVRGINTRNGVVHEAKSTAGLGVADLLAIRKCVQILLGLPELKSPHNSGANGVLASN